MSFLKLLPFLKPHVLNFWVKYRKGKFSFDGSLYWSDLNRFPFCSRCFGEDKCIEMQFIENYTNGQIDEYKCPVCGMSHRYDPQH